MVEGLAEAIDGKLRLYPDPTSSSLRAKLAKIHGFDAEQIIIGNGGDDILNLCVRAFCGECEKLAYFWPSYSLYPVLANIQGATPVELPLDENFQIEVHPPLLSKLDGVKLVFITQPNAPSGVWLQCVELQRVIDDFTAKGAAGLIMDVNTGEARRWLLADRRANTSSPWSCGTSTLGMP